MADTYVIDASGYPLPTFTPVPVLFGQGMHYPFSFGYRQNKSGYYSLHHVLLSAIRPVVLSGTALFAVPLIHAVLASHASVQSLSAPAPHAPPRWQDLAVHTLLRQRHHHLHQLRREQVAVIAVTAQYWLLVGIDVSGSLQLQARQLHLKLSFHPGRSPVKARGCPGTPSNSKNSKGLAKFGPIGNPHGSR